MDVTINSVEELYDRLKPALNIKYQEVMKYNLDYVKIEDIWNYLKVSKWKNANDLLLYEMVDDIFNCELYDLKRYVEARIKLEKVQADLTM